MSKANGEYDVYWYDIEKGGDFQQGSVKTVNGGGTVSLGNAPSGGNWVIIVTKPAPVSVEKNIQRKESGIGFRSLPAVNGTAALSCRIPE